MRLFEAILDANHRAVSGDTSAGLRPADYESELPIAALTCIDARLNSILPQVLGVPAEQFIWLRNAGNIITGPLSSTLRSMALACAIKGAKEIAVIGHTDCQVAKTTTMQHIDRLKALGVERTTLPDNINEYFGMFGSERQNVIKATGIVRGSPLIGPKIPVHGLLVDTDSGRLEWLVNGYDSLGTAVSPWGKVVASGQQTIDALKDFAEFKLGQLNLPETKIGEIVSKAEHWVTEKLPAPAPQPPAPPPAPVPAPPKLPLPPPLRPRMTLRRKPR